MLGDLLQEPIRLRFPCDATKERYERWLFDSATNSIRPSERPSELGPWLNCADGSERCAPHQESQELWLSPHALQDSTSPAPPPSDLPAASGARPRGSPLEAEVVSWCGAIPTLSR